MDYVNHDKVKSDIFYKLFYNFLYFFFIYIKISKNFSAKYYQENKERLQKKKLVKDLNQNFSKEEKGERATISS